jgi:hypothetical protein
MPTRTDQRLYRSVIRLSCSMTRSVTDVNGSRGRNARPSFECSKIASDRAIYLEELDRSAGNLDESDYHSRTIAPSPSDGEQCVANVKVKRRSGVRSAAEPD